MAAGPCYLERANVLTSVLTFATFFKRNSIKNSFLLILIALKKYEKLVFLFCLQTREKRTSSYYDKQFCKIKQMSLSGVSCALSLLWSLPLIGPSIGWSFRRSVMLLSNLKELDRA